ncbi:MAG: DUF5317 domain-containing protein [Actinomycetota bacterium]
MSVVLIVIIVALVAGFLARGTLRNFERVDIHWWGVAAAGLLLQIVPVHRWFDDDVVVGTVLASYVLLIAFVWVNRRVPAAPLMLAGLALNVVVIAANGGMPVSADAIRTTGSDARSLPAVIDDGKHHLMTSSDVLTPLADVIGLPPPFATVLSVGDVLLYSGVVAFTVLIMRGRFAENRRPPAWIPMYRGKHLPPNRRLPHRPRPASPIAAVSSGTSR